MSRPRGALVEEGDLMPHPSPFPRPPLRRWARAASLLVLPAAFVVLVAAGDATAGDAWPQWGGPHRDFTSDAQGLATAWPEGGPQLVWERELGEGYSGLVAAGDRLYTLYHRGGEEVVVAVDAGNGATVWEIAYPAPALPEMNLEHGPGPHATPALAGERIFTIGSTLKVHGLDRATGRVLWAHDLVAELGAPVQPRGFGASPLVWEDLVIVTPGGDGTAVVAFRQSDGARAWASQSFRPSYSSPILAEVGGEEQVIVAMGPDRAGLDPRTGELEWRLTLRGEAANVMATQIWGEDGVLFGSAAYTDGSRAIRVTREGEGKFAAEELWFNTRMRVQHGTMVRLGDYVYGSSGDFGPTLLAAIHVGTGELAFRQRGFAKANLLAAGGHLLILDEDGVLAIGTPGPEGVDVHARARVLDRVAWTAPILVGTRLYVRDRRHVKAFELGARRPS
jgi:outer membrane protein assembly factor BamB